MSKNARQKTHRETIWISSKASQNSEAEARQAAYVKMIDRHDATIIKMDLRRSEEEKFKDAVQNGITLIETIPIEQAKVLLQMLLELNQHR